jgi:hypothetical protein
MIKITPSVLGASLLVAVFVSLASWCWLLLTRFAVPEPQWLALAQELPYAFSPVLRWTALQSPVQGFVPVGVLLYLVGDWAMPDTRVVRGARLVSAKVLAMRTRLKRRQSRIERGLCSPSLRTIERIAAVLEVPPLALFMDCSDGLVTASTERALAALVAVLTTDRLAGRLISRH